MNRTRDLRKLEIRFLKAEKKAVTALTALSCGAGAVALSQLQGSVENMKSLLPAFEKLTGGELAFAAVSRAEDAVQAISANIAGNTNLSDGLLASAGNAINAAHASLSAMLPADFVPLVNGGQKPPPETMI